MTFIEGGVEADPEVPRLEKVNVFASLRPRKDEAVMNTSDNGLRPECGEVLFSEPVQETSPTDKGKDKMPTEQDDERAEFIGDEFNSDLDSEDYEMNNSGTT